MFPLCKLSHSKYETLLIHFGFPESSSYLPQFALLIIGRCGFGFDFNWSTPPKATDGRISVQEALRIVADNYMIMIMAPRFIQNLPIRKYVDFLLLKWTHVEHTGVYNRLKGIREAHDQLMNFMQVQVNQRKAEIHSVGETGATSSGRSDAFTLLVKANEDEGGKFKLDDQELVCLSRHQCRPRGNLDI